MPERTIEDPVLRQRFRFHRTTGPDGEDVLVVEGWVDPGGGVTPHVHPAMEERFTVVRGTLLVLAGRRWLQAAAGRRPGGARRPARLPQRHRRDRALPLRGAPAGRAAGLPRGRGGAQPRRSLHSPRAAARPGRAARGGRARRALRGHRSPALPADAAALAAAARGAGARPAGAPAGLSAGAAAQVDLRHAWKAASRSASSRSSRRAAASSGRTGRARSRRP